jgi:glycosyltransferase involved in cell wall biosynthesis
MTIAYIYHLNAALPGIQSGRPFSILRQFHEHANVLPIFPLQQTRAVARLVRQLVAAATCRRYLSDRHPAMLRDFANEAMRRLSSDHYDIVFSPSTLPVTFLETTRPVTVCADATFHSMVDYYPSFSFLSRAQRDAAEKLESQALRRCSLLVYSSDWAARSAIAHYGIAKDRVTVLPSGANFGAENTRANVLRWIERRSRDNLRLLFIGKEWRRKGGDIAFETMRLLSGSGYRASLDIVGCLPPPNVAAHPEVRLHGQLSIARPEQRAKLTSLFAQAHFLLVPTRAEAFGMVFCEANAFGLPAIATATGGTRTIIRDGVNGYVLPLSAGPPEYAKLIGAITDNLPEYQRLAESSFAEFEARLNWKAWIGRYMEIAKSVALGTVEEVS